MHIWEGIDFGHLPPMDQALRSLVSPSKSVLGKLSRSRNTKMTDAMLARVHIAVAIQGQLVNTRTILALYQRQLAKQLGEGQTDLAAVMRQVSALLAMLMRGAGSSTGRAMALCMVIFDCLSHNCKGKTGPVC